MSDLSATNCGCDNNCGNGWGNNSCLWIILLLFFCGGCGNNRMGDNGCGCDCLWIILLLFFCGGCGNNRMGDCGCGC
jgi:hypothetical protein